MPGVRKSNRKTQSIQLVWGGRLSKWIDDTIYNCVSPTWGSQTQECSFAQRSCCRTRVAETGRQLDPARTTNRDGKWLETGYSIDTVLNLDIGELQDRCAELYRTNNVAHAAIEGRVVQRSRHRASRASRACARSKRII